ncbi:beta-1,4-N-acetylgalactosaminyltransferase bre-4-like [Aphis craccivora]|uniref:Beta-1,4-N-acetylgalactosaminyltransferase n=1 Tax=Aphis craccivora TaxID=307492 RepID=A0A6G0XZV0_APHCR|nr:beta-1,4-N-acetylgalactosaminyltransferase bre-4-like [Aphis craccivora]
MFLQQFLRIKILIGLGIICLLVQCLYYVNYYTLINTIQQYVPSTKDEPKTMVDNKNQTNELENNNVKLINLVPCPQISSALSERVGLFTPAQNNLEDVALQLSQLRILEGGHQMPLECKARYKVAILVPYRNRFKNLCWFLLNLHPFLTKQKLDYTIFIIEQFSEESNDGRFNRGKLLNIGFTEALKLSDFDCFFFHDVDLLPINNGNIYSCPDQPRHYAVAVDKYKNVLPYGEYFGGVTAMSRTHFELINGFSNIFWGWGGEDDDLYYRTKGHNLNITRYPPEVACYHSLSHAKQKANPHRFKLLKTSSLRFNTDGLNSLNYEIKSLKKLPLYTHILVDVDDRHKLWR